MVKHNLKILRGKIIKVCLAIFQHNYERVKVGLSPSKKVFLFASMKFL